MRSWLVDSQVPLGSTRDGKISSRGSARACSGSQSGRQGDCLSGQARHEVDGASGGSVPAVELYREQSAELAALISLEMGKPLAQARAW
jgi:hypothetical protein